MSGTHAHTASARADLARADVQGDKPHMPPGHVEDERDERPVPQRGIRRTGPYFGGGLLVIAAVLALVFWLA